MKKISYICDRCGKSVKDPDAYNCIVIPMDSVFQKKFFKISSYTITSGGNTAASRSNDEPVHFCEDCKEKFFKFMTGEIGD